MSSSIFTNANGDLTLIGKLSLGFYVVFTIVGLINLWYMKRPRITPLATAENPNPVALPVVYLLEKYNKNLVYIDYTTMFVTLVTILAIMAMGTFHSTR
jgi:hypothetical protein